MCERIVIATSRDAVKIDDIPDAFFDEWEVTAKKGGKQKHTEERLFVFHSGQNLPQVLDGQFSMEAYLDECRKNLLKQALEQAGSTYKAAKLLGVSQSFIARYKRQYQLGEEEKS